MTRGEIHEGQLGLLWATYLRLRLKARGAAVSAAPQRSPIPCEEARFGIGKLNAAGFDLVLHITQHLYEGKRKQANCRDRVAFWGAKELQEVWGFLLMWRDTMCCENMEQSDGTIPDANAALKYVISLWETGKLRAPKPSDLKTEIPCFSEVPFKMLAISTQDLCFP